MAMMMIETAIPTDETMYDARARLRAPCGSVTALSLAIAAHET